MSPIHGILTKIKILPVMRLQLMKVSCNLKTEFPISERLLLKLRSVKVRKEEAKGNLFFSFLHGPRV